jgi:hypothetical protein
MEPRASSLMAEEQAKQETSSERNFLNTEQGFEALTAVVMKSSCFSDDGEN